MRQPTTKRPKSQWDKATGTAVLALGLSGVGVVVTWWLWSGYVMLPDFVVGPTNRLPAAFWGLGRDGRTDGIVIQMVAYLGRDLLGDRLFGWLVIASFFPVAGLGMARAVGGSITRRAAAGLLYCVNPFVLDRLVAGQVGVLWGMALLGWAFASWAQPTDTNESSRSLDPGRNRLTPLWWRLNAGLWLAVLTACSVHFAWIGAVGFFAAVIGTGGRHRTRDVLAAAGIALALSGYLLVPAVAGVVRSQVGIHDLFAYRTSTDGFRWVGWALATGGGFWRANESAVQASGIPGALAGLVLLLASSIGVIVCWCRARRRTVSLIVLAGIGLFVAAGNQGPTGALWDLAFRHVPTFAVLREPQKFLVLYVLAAAWFFGYGIEALVRRLPSGRSIRYTGLRAVALTAVVVVVVAYTPNLFAGANGSLVGAHYPASWEKANARMGSGSGRVLVFPWHEYSAHRFTTQAVTGAPANFFSRTTLTSRNPELGELRREPTATGHYVAELVARGGTIRRLGTLVTPLGVQYIILTNNDDASTYSWIDQQADLTLVYRGPDIQVWRNDSYTTSRRTGAIEVRNIEQLIDAANTGRLDDQIATITPHPNSHRAATSNPTSPTRAVGHVTPELPIQYRVGAGTGNLVEIPELYDPAWRLEGRPGFKTAAGTNAFDVGPQSHKIRYRDFDWVVAGYAESLFAFLAVVASLATIALVRRRPYHSLTTAPAPELGSAGRTGGMGT